MQSTFNGLYRTSPGCCMWLDSGLSSTRRTITQSFLVFVLLGLQNTGIKGRVAILINTAKMLKNWNNLRKRRGRHTFSVNSFFTLCQHFSTFQAALLCSPISTKEFFGSDFHTLQKVSYLLLG